MCRAYGGEVLNTERVKKGGVFSPFDLVVYAVLAALIVVLFLITAFSGGNNAAGVTATVEGECVYTYTFGKGGSIAGGKENFVTEEKTPTGVTVTFSFEGGGYNVLVIDEQKKEAFVSDANCSFKSDCAHMPSITEKGGVIVCVPHALIVQATGDSPDWKPSVG